MRHVVPFSRTAKMALSGLLERPDRFSPSCSASTTDSASTPDDKNRGGEPGDKWLADTLTHTPENMQNQQNLRRKRLEFKLKPPGIF